MSAEFLPRSDAMRAGLATMGIVLASVGFGLVPYFRAGADGRRHGAACDCVFPLCDCCNNVAAVCLAGAGAMADPCVGAGRRRGDGVGWIGYVRAVEVAPVSTVGILYMTYPVFTLLIAWLVFRRPAGRRARASQRLMIIAAAVLASSPSAVSVSQLPALVLSLAAPHWDLASASMCWCTSSALKPLARISCVSLGSVGAVCRCSWQRRQRPVPASASEAGGWWWASRSARR
jgi:hypothetical protein